MVSGVRVVRVASFLAFAPFRQYVTKAFNPTRATSRYLTSYELQHNAKGDVESWNRWKVASLQSKLLVNYGSTESFTSLSFFRFVDIQEPKLVVGKVAAALKSIDYPAPVYGTLLVAPEGFNGQFAVPTSALLEFYDQLSSADGVFSGFPLNVGDTIDYSVADVKFPFKKLVVKVKRHILTDGLPEDVTVDWRDPGPELDPVDWHNEVKAAAAATAQNEEESKVILLDCRNAYESEMGTFLGAEPMATDIFSESWAVFEERLKDVPRDARVLTFCTGGIRCVKTNAYLKQKLGFTNLGRLRDGIIGYERWLKETTQSQNQDQDQDQTNRDDTVMGAASKEECASNNMSINNNNGSETAEESVFVGTNFIFDRRRLED